MENYSEQIQSIKDHFQFCGINNSDQFDLIQFSAFVDLPIEICIVLLCNLEDWEVMQEIANGNYSTFDCDDKSQFNDGYSDMIDELDI